MTTLMHPLSRLFDTIEYIVDGTVGIIRHAGELPKEAGAPDFFHFYARACNTQAFSSQKNFGDAGGASADRGTALAKAIGEAVERYCSALYCREALPVTSFENASFPCVPPTEFALYSDAQYAQHGFHYVPFECDTPVRWTAAKDMATGDVCYVPAAMVFMPYMYAHEQGEPPITQPISTGLACHMSFAEATISALCEVIERDAFTIVWQAKLGMPQLQIDTLSDCNRDLVRRFERTGNTVTILNVTMDHGIPTILSVLHGQADDAPALVFAASADLNPERAIRKSLEELAHTRRLAQEFKIKLEPLVARTKYDNLIEQDDHVHLYCDHENTSLADFIFASQKRTSFSEIANLATGDPDADLQTVVNRVQTVNHRALVADLTTPDVGEFGFHVVRAIIPGFHPLFMGHPYRSLGGSRLWEIPQKLGHEGIRRASGDNFAPHPYP